jgi:response regulator NasT
MMDEAADHKLKNLLRKTKKQRSEEDKKTVNAAKLLLMDRNHMTEPEAYRFIQKTSMDTGRTMLETAQMILLFEEEPG